MAYIDSSNILAIIASMSSLATVTTGDPAAAGTIGEVLTASQTTNTVTGVAATGSWGSATSLLITKGVWGVFGSAGFVDNGATVTGSLSCGISNSATGVTLSDLDATIISLVLSLGTNFVIPTPPILIAIASDTTYYLNTKINYTLGTPKHRGKITALRIR